MALFQRPLIRLLAGLLVANLFASNLSAQSTPDETGTYTFRVFALSAELSGLFYDYEGRQISLVPSHWVFSQPYPRPQSGTLVLYREVPPVPPKTTPVRIVVAEIVIAPKAASLIFLASTPDPTSSQPRITGLVFDQSWQAHPAGTVQIFNFCKTQVALQAGGPLVPLQRATFISVPYPAQGERLWVKAAKPVDGKWKLGLSQPQRMQLSQPQTMQPDSRAIWVLLDTPYSIDQPDNDRIFLRKLTERAPATEAR